jgi:hypothetical protein
MQGSVGDGDGLARMYAANAKMWYQLCKNNFTKARVNEKCDDMGSLSETRVYNCETMSIY